MKRIRRLLYPTAPNSAWMPLVAAVVLIATTALVLEAWPAPPQQGANDQPTVVFRTEASPYHKWLNEDVVYIISDKERVAFQKLTTNDEHEKFIQQFWARRDPKPETLKNEFKDEHYRRIAYANERFRTASGRAGWLTDRGHMYILYGPPDEIESHPDNKPHPYEAWRYWHLEGVGDNRFFTFIDRSGSGDYQVAPGGSL